MSEATLNGFRVTHARVDVPAWGRWYAEVSLDGDHEIAGVVSLVVADVTFSGSVVSGGPHEGRTHLRLVGGRGRWDAEIPELGYANAASVSVASVLQDAAAACGETLVGALPSTRLGVNYARRAGPAARVLEALVPRGWYVAEDGTTRIGQRGSTTLRGTMSHGPVDLARGTVTLASESIAGIMPGLVVDGLTAVDVCHEITPEGLRSTVYGARGGSSRRLSAIQRLVEQADPLRDYRTTWEYRVTGRSGKRLDVEPVRASTGMPALTRVSVRPGLAGCDADVPTGQRVALVFLDADPSRPVVVSFEPADGQNFVPPVMRLAEGTAGQGVIRKSDEILLGYFCKDPSTNIIYQSPASLGPLATIYVPWWKVTSAADVTWCLATNPASPFPPPPGTPGTPLAAYHTTSSAKVRCGT